MLNITYDKKCVYKDGTPWVPYVGEIHYSRIPENEWQTELAKMLIESANACVTDMMRLQNHLQEKKGQSARLAASLIAFEEENVKRLRPYL